MTLDEARRHYKAGEFDKGSMGPKIKAIIDYMNHGGREGLITDPPHITLALTGGAGTRIIQNP